MPPVYKSALAVRLSVLRRKDIKKQQQIWFGKRGHSHENVANVIRHMDMCHFSQIYLVVYDSPIYYYSQFMENYRRNHGNNNTIFVNMKDQREWHDLEKQGLST